MMLKVTQFTLGSSPPKYQVVKHLWKIVKKLIAPYAHLMVLSKWNFSSMKKVRDVSFPTTVRRMAVRIQSQIIIKIAKEAFDFGKRFGISVNEDKTPAIRRITRSLKKELENKRHAED